MEKIYLSIMILSFSWIIFLGASFFLKINLPEKVLIQAVKWVSILVASLTTILTFLLIKDGQGPVLLDYPALIKVANYQFKIRIILDYLGSLYALLSSLLVGIIFRFSKNYLHREEGFFRFVLLLSVLLFGLLIVSFSRSLDLLFAGWELVGTTSVLLIGYFYTQVQPVRHSVKAIISYRLSDMGILAASAWAHHYLHSTDFLEIPHKLAEAHHAGPIVLIFIGIFVIWAALAKSGQLPFCSWLPAAMEGPTPSSAIFYGALSVHLGPFLLLRFYDYFSHFPFMLIIIGVIGGLTAFYASAVGRTRTDAKTMLGYATISQVGIMWVEIALGFTNFAIFHMMAHASLRTWQFLRSSSVIQDFFENPLVEQNVTIHRDIFLERMFSPPMRKAIFVHALHGFHLDYFTEKFLKALMWPIKMYIAFEKKGMELNNIILKRLIGKN